MTLAPSPHSGRVAMSKAGWFSRTRYGPAAVVPFGGGPVAAVEEALADSPELVPREPGEEVPGEVERVTDATPLRTLVDEALSRWSSCCRP